MNHNLCQRFRVCNATARGRRCRQRDERLVERRGAVAGVAGAIVVVTRSWTDLKRPAARRYQVAGSDSGALSRLAPQALGRLWRAGAGTGPGIFGEGMHGKRVHSAAQLVVTARNTMRCWATRGLPAKASETTTTLKWVSEPAGTLCCPLSFTTSRCIGARAPVSFLRIRCSTTIRDVSVTASDADKDTRPTRARERSTVRKPTPQRRPGATLRPIRGERPGSVVDTAKTGRRYAGMMYVPTGVDDRDSRLKATGADPSRLPRARLRRRRRTLPAIPRAGPRGAWAPRNARPRARHARWPQGGSRRS